jgi:hypothetical protein
MAIPDDDLEKVIKDAGLSPRTAKKLREANKTQAPAVETPGEAAPKPRGHGAPAPIRASLGDDF